MSTKHADAHRTQNDLLHQMLLQRYLDKDAHGRAIENEEQMFRRVANAVAAVEADYGVDAAEIDRVAVTFEHLMTERLFLPNSPTLMNAGRAEGMLSACFVLGVDDSIEGIFDALKLTATIQKAGGGTGFAFDSLRPTGDHVASSGGVTSGPISFWRVFAETTRAIQQGARRRGANMAMMAIDHPDILSFIAAKRDVSAFTNFNISVKITDASMDALRDRPNAPHAVVNPRTGNRYRLPKSLEAGEYGLADLLPEGSAAEACYTVQDVWDMIVTHAHATGEPGLCFIDRVNRDNPTPHLGRIEATNPCGEQPLLREEACCLGSINVAKLVQTDGSDLDWGELERTVSLAVRFLDNVIDASHYPADVIASATRGSRKIGLGVMGFADALVLLGIRYDSDEAVDLARKLGAEIQRAAHQASEDFAGQRGAFPNWEGSTWDTVHGRPMRNAACTTIAPTGSISILARCSAGIEPMYALAYRRRALDGGEFVQVHPLLEAMGERDGWLDDRVRRALLEGTPPAEIPGVPHQLADVLVTAHDVFPEWHVRIQAALQEHVDNAVSKTVNLAANASIVDVDRVYRMAFELRCKGTTVYRDGSREGQTLTGAATGDQSAIKPRRRVSVTHGSTRKFRMGCGTLFVTVNRDEQGLCEVFANLGKAGGCPAQSEATCRAVSVALRSGVDPRELLEQLKGIRCMSAARARQNGEDTVNVLSCPDAIAKAIEEATGIEPRELLREARAKCPDCGSPLRHESGCLVCSCGYSKCG